MFEDKNADLMKKLAGTIVPSERYASAGGDLSKLGPISSQFFPQKEMNVVPLSTDELVLSMAGGEDVRRQRLRAQLQQMYPGQPQLWDVEPPVKERTYSGGMYWPTPSEKAQGGSLAKRSDPDAQLMEMLIRGAAAGVDLSAVDADVMASLRDMVKTGKIQLVESPGRLSISTV